MEQIPVGLIGTGYIGMVHLEGLRRIENMTLPTGHPMGYHDAMYNLFKDYYEILILNRNGKKYHSTLPDFKTGYENMCVIDTAIKSNKSGNWGKVIY